MAETSRIKRILLRWMLRQTALFCGMFRARCPECQFGILAALVRKSKSCRVISLMINMSMIKEADRCKALAA